MCYLQPERFAVCIAVMEHDNIISILPDTRSHVSYLGLGF